MRILVTGATGFIGSNTCVELLEAGYDVVGVDNLSNSNINIIDEIERITNKRVNFYNIDLRDMSSLEQVFIENRIASVIHFAALKSVEESCINPFHYYDNNIIGTTQLLACMEKHKINKLVFSSSATVYAPINENRGLSEWDLLGPSNPYGRTKLIIEQMLQDISTSDTNKAYISLRYFNPVGAHNSGLLGENPKDTPKNLVPYVANVAIGKYEYVNVYGDKYDTRDGTGARDYIHVSDVAQGHIAALKYMDKHSGYDVFNLGLGRATTVLELISEYEKVSGKKINYVLKENRPGDVGVCYANNKKALELLNWTPRFDLEKMCQDSWHAVNKLIDFK